jgi:hypothetical protein
MNAPEGIDKVHRSLAGRPADALLANAGHGLGKGFSISPLKAGLRR